MDGKRNEYLNKYYKNKLREELIKLGFIYQSESESVMENYNDGKISIGFSKEKATIRYKDTAIISRYTNIESFLNDIDDLVKNYEDYHLMKKL